MGNLGVGETKLRIITDGDRGLRMTVQRSVGCESRHVLHWFYIAMRLTSIDRSTEPVLYRTKFPNFLSGMSSWSCNQYDNTYGTATSHM